LFSPGVMSWGLDVPLHRRIPGLKRETWGTRPLFIFESSFG
jgi:hypothetical protein